MLPQISSTCSKLPGDRWHDMASVSNLKKNLWPFLWLGFNCLKATEPLRGGSLPFTTKFPEVHLINLGIMKG